MGSGKYKSMAFALALSFTVTALCTSVAFAQVPPGAGRTPGVAGPSGVGGPPPGAPPPGGPPPPGGTTGLTLDKVTLQSGPKSAGRAAPVPATPPREIVGPVGPIVSAKDGAVPKGIKPLKRTLFNSDDFYADRDLWTDPRYFHCASPNALEGLWETSPGVTDRAADVLGNNFPKTVAWGNCNIDFPRKQIVSPYPYKTAQAQYEALLAEAKSRSGPTIHTKNTLPDWSGVYARIGFLVPGSGPGPVEKSTWLRGYINQASTYVSLLTPEYQTRMVQQMYHTAHSNAPQWPGSYCWPEGFMRRWWEPDRWVSLTKDGMLAWNHVSETVFTQISFNRSFNMQGPVPRLGEDVRSWFGETVGFWDGNILITWTSNIRSWIAHGWFEWSNQLQTIEIYTPLTGPDGAFAGINHEAILYDPEALVEPVRIIDNWEWSRALNQGAPFEWRECIQTLFPIDGLTRPVNPGDTIEFTVPDMSNRPWAQIWEKYFEKGMKKPEGPDVLDGFR